MWIALSQVALLLLPVLALLAVMAMRQRSLAGLDTAAKQLTVLQWGLSHRRDILVLAITAVAIAAVFSQVDNASERLELPKLEPMSLIERVSDGRQIDTTLYQTPIPQSNLASVDEMIARLEQRLAHSPGDVAGWRMLGWSYLHTDHPEKAVQGYRKAITLAPDDAGLRSSLAEALIAEAGGTITEEARVTIAQALARDSKDTLGRYLHGVGLQQAGERSGAMRAWQELAADLPADDMIAKLAKDRLSALITPVDE